MEKASVKGEALTISYLFTPGSIPLVPMIFFFYHIKLSCININIILHHN